MKNNDGFLKKVATHESEADLNTKFHSAPRFAFLTGLLGLRGRFLAARQTTPGQARALAAVRVLQAIATVSAT